MVLAASWDNMIPPRISKVRRAAIIDFLDSSGISKQHYEHTALRQMIANADWGALAAEVQRYVYTAFEVDNTLIKIRQRQAQDILNG